MRTATIICAIAAFGLLACGGDSAEDQLAAVNEGLREAREEVRDAQERVLSLEENVAQVREELGEAQRAAAEAEAKLALVEVEVDVEATDALLFRAIQARLLEDEQLRRVAIRADVDRGVVTLEGTVPDGELRDHARAVASEIEGVMRVESRIEVQVAAESQE